MFNLFINKLNIIVIMSENIDNITNNITDNIIEFMFEKIFDSYYKKDDFYKVPFEVIKRMTFENDNIHSLINQLTNRDINIIKSYLNNVIYQEKFIDNLLKDKLSVDILFDKAEKSHVTNDNLHICLINNKLNYFEMLASDKTLSIDLLMYVAEWSLEDVYFHLRNKKLYPNLSILKKACLGESVKILSDCLEFVGPTKDMIESAFQNNKTNIIMRLIEDQKTVCNNFVAYVLANNNVPLLKYLEENNYIKWHSELYYSALLSGSIDMIKYVESKMMHVHDNHMLDISNSTSGEKSLLLDEIIYIVDRKTYFAHTMNYAIQSGSFDVVKYIRSLKYGIALANIISAINKGDLEILKYIISEYSCDLPFYLIHYVGITNYCPNKLKSAKYLKENTNIFEKKPENIKDYKLERVHLEIIHSKEQIDCDSDIDYLMKHSIFFECETNMNYRLLNHTITLIRLGYDVDFNEKIIDVVYLFGNLKQIKQINGTPNIRIVAELFCRYQIAKLLKLKIPYEYRYNLKNVVLSLNDDNLTKVYNIIINKN